MLLARQSLADSSEPTLRHPTPVDPLPQIDPRYSIERELGRGGMGRVFAARDEKLGRKVAIKVLAPGSGGEDSLRRFEQEARAAGSLDHPNVLTVHDIGSWQGGPYIVSELLQGRTLREWLGEKPLPIAKAVDYALQLAQGLCAAHDHGVVHRDLKPENLFVTHEGRLKILDFGIAKLVGAGAPSRHTDTGALIGTVEYMSPEQVRGEPADLRSDIFSAGTILYEMLSGRLPFEHGAAVEIGHSILHDEPPALPSQVPRELDRIVRRCLEKDPKDRFQSAHELALALAKLPPPSPARSWRWPAALVAIAAALVASALIDRMHARPAGAGEASIAVVPFANMSSDKENEYFSDGITEELINALANIPGLRVASRTSAFALKGKGLDARQIGDKLGVKTLLEGSVRREGNALRVTAQLINVSDDVHLWSQSYDRELKGIFALEDEIARSIAQTLRRRLSGGEAAPLVKPSTASQEAHDLYLRGQYFKERRKAESLRSAAAYFEQAIEKDPSYALAYVGLANSATLRLQYDAAHASAMLPKAKQAALRALELDPGLAEAHASLGLIAQLEYDWPASERSLRRAVELKPEYPDAHHWYAMVLAFTGRIREARAEAEKAVRLDPSSIPRNNLVAVMALYDRDDRVAEEGFKKTLEMDSGFVGSHSYLGVLYALQGRYAEAEPELEKGFAGFSQVYRGVMYARAGRRKDALNMVEQLEERAKHEQVSRAPRGFIWVALGEKERGYTLLEKACAERTWMLWEAKVNPMFESMRADPGFKSLLKCVHLE
jgi:serine/threonine-protein kinase